MALTKRLVKGSPLTAAEHDANLDYLNARRINVKTEYGAVGDDAADDAPAFRMCMDYCIANGYVMLIPPGTYRMDTAQQVLLNSDLRIENQGVIKAWQGIFAITSSSIDPGLAANITRGDLTCQVTSATGLEVGDSLDMYTDTVVEASWSVPKGEAHRITDISGNTLTVDRPFLWDYATGETGLVFRARKFRNLHIEGGTWYSTRQDNNFTFNSLHLSANNVKLYADVDGTPDPDGTPRTDNRDGWTLAACTADIRNVSMVNHRYAIEFTRCMGSIVDGVHADHVRHPVDSAVWSDGIVCKNMVARNCTQAVACHPSFNVSFIDCYETGSISAPLPVRAMGVTLRNVYCETSGSAACLMGNMSLNAPYENMEQEYSGKISDVTVIAPNADADGESLGWLGGGPVEFRNCVASDITTRGDTKIFGGRIGKIRPSGNCTQIEMHGVTFDLDLYFGTLYPLYVDVDTVVRFAMFGGSIEGLGTGNYAFYDSVDGSANNCTRIFSGVDFKGSTYTSLSAGAGQANKYLLTNCTMHDDTVSVSSYGDATVTACAGIT